MRLYITLGLLVFAPLSLKNAEAAYQSDGRANSHKVQKPTLAATNSAKRKVVLHKNYKKAQQKKRLVKKNQTLATPTLAKHPVSAKQKANLIKSNALKTARVTRHNRKLALYNEVKPIRMNAEHQKRYIKARQTAIAKLMKQLGKPYVWGGTSPKTGFDCSGLVYYAYKDLVKFKIPRTANAMYHLKSAKPINRSALQRGDLVFFKINQRSMADHVGVYLGNGKFIQSPSTGKSIKITALNEGYWQRHYLGARRMMTPLTIR